MTSSNIFQRMHLVLLLLIALVRVALIVDSQLLLYFLTLFLALLDPCSGSILVTVNLVKFLKAVLCNYASLIFIRNGAVSVSLDIIGLNLELLFHLLELLLVQLIDAIKDFPLHHAGSLGT